MQVRITQKPDDGNFEVGEVYEVQSLHKMFVYAIDKDGEAEVVYNYQYVVI